jgi:Protein of unknown function (DUF3363)
MSDDPDFSRRSFLRGLGAAAAASAAPKDVIETTTKAAGENLHPLATKIATDVLRLHEPYYAQQGPSDFQDLRAEAIQHLTDLADNYVEEPHTYSERVYRDAARLLESGWTPPARLLPDTWTRAIEDHGVAPEEPHQASATQQEAGRVPPEGQTLPGTPRGAISAVEVEKPEITAYQPEVSIRQQGEPDAIGISAVTERADLAAKTNKQEEERELLQPDESHEGGPDFSRRSFLRGLGAAAAASAAPADIVEAAAMAVEPSPRLRAMESATNVWHLLEPHYLHYGPNEFQDLRAEAIRYLTDVADDLDRDPRTFEDKIRTYRDAAGLLESGWTPPARLLPNTWTRTTEDHGVAPEEPHQASATQQEAGRVPPEGQTLPGTPHEAVPTVEVKEPQIAAYRPEVSTERADEYPDLAANPDPVGVAIRFPDGGISVHLGNGEWEDIDRTPGAFTAARLWPGYNNGTEDYRLYDHTGKQVAHADVAIVGDHAHIANVEAEDGVNTLGIKALRILQAKLKEEFPELTSVKGLRSGGAGPGRTQEVEFQHSTPNEGEPLDRVTASTKEHRHDFDGAVARLSAETGLPHTPAVSGEFVAGIYRQSLTLTSGQFAVIDNGLGFALVPWTAELDKRLGRHVSGVAMESGGVEWSFGRKRGLEI